MKIKELIALILFLTLLLPVLTGCGANDKGIVQNGIAIREDGDYSGATLEYARERVYTVLEAAALTELPAVTDKKREEFLKIADDVTRITAKDPISDEKYRRLLDTVAEDGSALLGSLDSDDAAISGIKELYLGVSGIIGADRAGELLYDLTLYGYRYKRDKTLARYETYGYTYLKEEAEKLAYDSETLETEVGKDSFVLFMKLIFAVSELLIGDVSIDSCGDFSDEEIITFLGYSDALDISVSERGWSLLLSLSDKLTKEESSQVVSLLASREYTDRVARSMPSALALLSKVSKRLTPADVGEIRNMNREEVIVTLLSGLTDEEWELFESAADMELDTEELDEAALFDYGEGYLVYKSEIVKITAHELREALEKDKSYESVRDYLGGLCPAVLYGFEK